MALTRDQLIFRDVFADRTGFDRAFVGAWMLAEQSGSAAQHYQSRGYNNWLNIGNTDQLVASGGIFKGDVWANPVTAAEASAQWVYGRGPVTESYGKAAPGILAMVRTVGQGAEAQIRALSSSGWATSGYNGGSTLRQLLKLGGAGSSGQKVTYKRLDSKGDASHLGGIAEIGGNVANAGADAVETVKDGAGAVADMASAVVGFLGNLGDPAFWARVAKVVLGFLLLAYGLWRMV